MAVCVESLHATRRESRGETRTVGSPGPRHNLKNASGDMPRVLACSNRFTCASPGLCDAMARMAVPTLGYDCSTDSLHDEIFYTLARLNADPVASDLAAAFASRLDEFRTLAANEITLTEAPGRRQNIRGDCQHSANGSTGAASLEQL